MNDNTMHDMHDAANEAFLRRLSEQLLALRSRTGYLSQATQAPTRSATTPVDTAQGGVKPGSDSGGNQGQGVKV